MSAAEKLDLFKQHKAEYAAKRTPAVVEVGPAQYLAIAGAGRPGAEAFEPKFTALYGVAFTLKFAAKAAGRDFKVCPPEGVYWLAGGGRDFAAAPAGKWRWKLMIRVPGFIVPAHLLVACEILKDKGKTGQFAKVKLEHAEEGRCVQMLHLGPFEKVGQTYQAMADHAAAAGLKLRGRPHEIYLSDPRRVPPARLRTICRQPVRPG